MKFDIENFAVKMNKGVATIQNEVDNSETKIQNLKSAVRHVAVRYVVKRIRELDEERDTFYADFFLETKWFEPELNGKENQDIKELSSYWNPRLVVENALGAVEVESELLFSLDSGGKAIVTELRHIKGNFLHNFELGHFPLDTQELEIIIKSERSDNKLNFVRSEISTINRQFTLRDWKINYCVDLTNKNVYDEIRSKSNPTVRATIRILRFPGFYIANYFLPLFLISLGIPMTFLLDVATQTHVRLTLAFLMTLSMMIWKLLVTGSMPNIKTTTFLEVNFVIVFISNITVAAWHAMTYLITDFNTKKQADLYFMMVLLFFFTLSHVIFYTWMFAVFNDYDKTRKRAEARFKVQIARLKEIAGNTKMVQTSISTATSTKRQSDQSDNNEYTKLQHTEQPQVLAPYSLYEKTNDTDKLFDPSLGRDRNADRVPKILTDEGLKSDHRKGYKIDKIVTGSYRINKL
ncbi:unnamed protein product [Owenia fusiformis]|uniref:Neurotransmitter-gated ion-channel ligand-binding domain-containing protein n=1 Tax=Owenia fusiformis TaxID=6347 RepID=A0A8S4Q6I2_OWEFU|nr:unnamed protein product [Owenia fusiformis]